jgi:endo-1,4-beta-xylanase
MDERFLAFFQIFNKHSDKISRVTTWGIGDANSWRNDWPIAGRTDYPLLFDRAYQPKPVVEKIIALTKQ